MTPLQALVAKHYCDGYFAHVTNPEEGVDDSLFTFCMREATEAGTGEEFGDMLELAIDQLRALQNCVDNETLEKEGHLFPQSNAFLKRMIR